MAVFSPAPMIAASVIMSNNSMSMGRIRNGYGGRTERPYQMGQEEKGVMIACFSFIALITAFAAYVAFETKTMVETTYISPGTVIAAEPRTVGSKSSRREGIIQYWVRDSAGVVHHYNTGIHYSKCPFIDYKTPIDVKVVKKDNPYTGASYWSATLATHVCKTQ